MVNIFRAVMIPLRPGKEYILQRGFGKSNEKLTVESLVAGGGQAAIYKGKMTNLGDVVIRTINTRNPRLSAAIIRNSVAKEIGALKNTRLSVKENKRNASNVDGCNPHINCYYGMIKHGRLAEGGGGGGGGGENVPVGNAEPFVYWSTETLPDYIYLIYEFITGQTLETKIQEGLNEEQIKSYGRQLLLGIKSLHELNKVHLDLKPANIMITADNKLKIIDFGLARDVNDVLVGRLPGFSLDHIAPEGWELTANPKTVFARYVRTRVIDPKAIDMFAIGCIIYNMCTKTKLIEDNPAASMSFKERDPETIVIPTYPKYQSFVRRLVSFNKLVLHIIEGVNNIPRFEEIGRWTSQIKMEREEAETKLKTVEKSYEEALATESDLTAARENMRAAQQVANMSLQLVKSFLSTAEGAATAASIAAARAGKTGATPAAAAPAAPAPAPAAAAPAPAAAGGAGAAPAAAGRTGAAPAAATLPKVSSNRPSAPDALRMWCELNDIPLEECGRMAGGRRRSRRHQTPRLLKQKQTRRRRGMV